MGVRNCKLQVRMAAEAVHALEGRGGGALDGPAIHLGALSQCCAMRFIVMLMRSA